MKRWIIMAACLLLTIVGQNQLAEASAAAVKPQPITQSLEQAATDRPLLSWSLVPGSASYEVEFLEKMPENPNASDASKYRLRAVRDIFTLGYQADLSDYPGKAVYWRVRGLTLDGRPVGVFSDAQKITLQHGRITLLRPTLTARFNEAGQATPLYPVYAWIPVPGAYAYEVEVLDQAPEATEEDSTAASSHRIWRKRVEGYDCYDDVARIRPGVYYWRVRGLDALGGPIGGFSSTGQFRVDLSQAVYAATLGDSITHGGGDVSYSPADREYCYQTYLDFPTVNLGRSGDTARQILNRFEADVVPYHPQNLIILAGTNSLRDGVNADTVIRELTALRQKCLNWGIRPIFLTLPPLNPTLIAQVSESSTARNWRSEYDKVNRFILSQPYCIDIAPSLSDEKGWLPEEYAMDGLHPGVEAKKIMARIINENWSRVSQ
ncbi:GDSL-type esterase/lipase family protein [Azotosporobacter soli]|uniref:GDSL-type esterase/lipase family protein n=1 Tax=Azotosporobacter soli TaxID=3055040 RepID=UPI0031FEE4FF